MKLRLFNFVFLS